MDFIKEYILRKEVIAPILIIIICMIVCKVASKIIVKAFSLKKTKGNEGKKKTIINLINNIVKFVVIVLGILTILEIYGIDTQSLIASLGIAGLVVGLALQDILKDFIVGVSIIFDGTFSIGDCVEIGGFKGEVLASNLRTTKLKSATGEIKIISNRNVLDVINYTMENATLAIDIDVAYESDIKKVKEVLDKLCEKIKDEYNLKEISCLGIQELASSSIKFRIVASLPHGEQFDLAREIRKQVVLTFEKNNITIPYNQLVIHNG